MKSIFKFKNWYYQKREKYCFKKYQKYAQLLETHSMFWYFATNMESYYRRKEFLSNRCEKYKKRFEYFSTT